MIQINVILLHLQSFAGTDCDDSDDFKQLAEQFPSQKTFPHVTKRLQHDLNMNSMDIPRHLDCSLTSTLNIFSRMFVSKQLFVFIPF